MDQIAFSGCFVCGPDNRCGLRAEFRNLEDGGVEGTFVPEEIHCGYQDIVHGGILMGFLDEVLGRLAFRQDRLFLTHTLEVSFRKAAAPGDRLRAVGTLLDWSRRQFTCEGVLYDSKDEVVATARGRFLVMNEKMERELLPDGITLAGGSESEK